MSPVKEFYKLKFNELTKTSVYNEIFKGSAAAASNRKDVFPKLNEKDKVSQVFYRSSLILKGKRVCPWLAEYTSTEYRVVTIYSFLPGMLTKHISGLK